MWKLLITPECIIISIIITISVISGIIYYKIDCIRSSYETRINKLTQEKETIIRNLKQNVNKLKTALNNTDLTCIDSKTVKYYVTIKTNNEKKYTLPADILVSTYTSFDYTNNFENFDINDFRIVSYILLKVYWVNGGFLRFSDEENLEDKIEPQLLKKDKPVIVSDIYGNEYTVVLTNKLVETNIAELNNIRAEKNKFNRYMKNTFKDLHKLRDELLIDYPYFATLIADYEKYTNDRYAYILKNKPRPAFKASDIVSANSKKIHYITQENKLLKYQMEIYESFFPFLSDYKEISKEDYKIITETNLNENNEKNIFSEYLSPQEYNSLSQEEKCQLSLERYKKKKKTLWQVGRDYERYIGYLYEAKGYTVKYFGAIKGYEDLGRDLIATNNNETLIIQCKYWNEHKTIHEKHIFQLFGTFFEYKFQYPKKDVKAVFVTSTTLSEISLKFAEKLNIEIIQGLKYDNTYPMIKCNINRATGEKIFHLPFDLQYDNIIIEPQKGECYTATVAEAVKKGFRHSYKWLPN